MERTGRQLTEAETKRFAYLTDPATGEQSRRGYHVELGLRHEAGQHETLRYSDCYLCKEADAERDDYPNVLALLREEAWVGSDDDINRSIALLNDVLKAREEQR